MPAPGNIEDKLHYRDGYAIPVIYTPLTHLTGHWGNCQKSRCNYLELDYVRCASRVGEIRARYQCRKYLEDLHECIFRSTTVSNSDARNSTLIIALHVRALLVCVGTSPHWQDTFVLQYKRVLAMNEERKKQGREPLPTPAPDSVIYNQEAPLWNELLACEKTLCGNHGGN